MPSALLGPLRWLSAVVVLGVVVYVVTPLAWDAVRSSVEFGDPSDAQGSPEEQEVEAAEPTEPQRRQENQRAQGDGRAEGDQQAERPPREAQPQPTPEPTPEFDTYVVEGGDTLAEIAGEVYGDETLWPVIAEANDIENTAGLVIGQELRIPPEPSE